MISVSSTCMSSNDTFKVCSSMVLCMKEMPCHVDNGTKTPVYA